MLGNYWHAKADKANTKNFEALITHYLAPKTAINDK